MDYTDLLKVIYRFFDPSLPRLGPGTVRSTEKALELVLSERSRQMASSGSGKVRVLDLGCGNGTQTIQLAKRIDGTILAVDNHQPYLRELRRRARAEAVFEKIQPCLKDMNHLGLKKRSFEVIWSEGALYNMGFSKALKACHALLVSGGFLAASELCWFRPDPPAECRDFFAAEYPSMKDVDANLSTIERNGYTLVGHFNLPEEAWQESYYLPLEDRLRLFRKDYAADPKWNNMLDSISREIEIYRKYSRYYGYAFFLMQRA